MYKQFPSYDMKIILGDMNAKLGNECLVVSEAPTLIAVDVTLSLVFIYSKRLPISGYWQSAGQG